MKPPLKILAIDPGTVESAFLVWDNGVEESGFVPNEELLRMLKTREDYWYDVAAIEMIASYGMAVGRETFETVLWIGRFFERSINPRLIYRKDVKIHLCGTTKAKDGNIRQALIDKHGAPGTKKAPGATYGVSGHLWAALAVADYAANNPL